MRTFIALFVATSLVGCASARSIGHSDAYEHVERAPVTMIEPQKTTTYHRVPMQSCGTRVENSRITERCTTYNDSMYTTRITGYKITFEYRGTLRTVMMAYDPGSHVNIKVVTNVFVLE
jgi:uncharacterized protein YcfJ